MELTGKCREDFEKWLNKNWEEKFLTGTQRAYEFYSLKWFNEFTLSMQWGVYLDFFDSKGIIFTVGIYGYHLKSEFKTMSIKVDGGRKASIESAIEKANELYNNQP